MGGFVKTKLENNEVISRSPPGGHSPVLPYTLSIYTKLFLWVRGKLKNCVVQHKSRFHHVVLLTAHSNLKDVCSQCTNPLFYPAFWVKSLFIGLVRNPELTSFLCIKCYITNVWFLF